MITHEITDIRPYYDKWKVHCVVTDSITSNTYDFNWQFSTEVTAESPEVIAQAVEVKLEIQLEIMMEENDMNLAADEEAALDYLRQVKAGIVGEIRTNPDATLAQASAWVEMTYPDSVINFPRIYQWYLNLLNLSTWDEFKAFCIAHTFRGVDD